LGRFTQGGALGYNDFAPTGLQGGAPREGTRPTRSAAEVGDPTS
jgi:hypothetical protein